MAKDLTKPNDIFVATLKNPEISTSQLLNSNINSNNTSFLSVDEYRDTPLVLKAFTKDDVFDETAFLNYYKLAEAKYHDLSDKDAFENLNKELEYSKSSIYRPLDAKIRDNSFKLTTLNNPLGSSVGIIGINRKDDSRYTEEEAALRNRIYDPSTGTWLNDTPESLSLLDKAFGKTLVYAKYSEDTVDPDGTMHYKGEWKKDQNGNYYTEILDSEELYDKQVVALSDILTKEDSWLNKVDFFDSDGYDKSAAGIAAKTMVQIIPWLIPGFNKYYGAITATASLASVLPTFYKSFEHILTGDEDGFLSEDATRVENWFRKFEGSKSREGREGFWNLESIAQLTTEIFGQLYEQRAAASLAQYVKGLNAEQTNLLGLRLSLAYMGLISSNDVYNTALLGGYDKRTAGIASLATAGALFGIMNFNETTRGLGTWFLNETTGASQEVMVAPVKKAAIENFEAFAAGMKQAEKTGEKFVLAKAFSKFKTDAGLGIQKALIMPTESMWKSAMVESVEEVSEEVIQDMVKGITDALSSLGYTQKQGSFGGWDNVFSKEGFERYLATFVGGGLGGALFHANIDYIEPFIKSFQTGQSMQLNKIKYDLVDLSLKGQIPLYIEQLKKLKPILNNQFAVLQTKLADGSQVGQLAQLGSTQADFIVNTLIREAEMYDKLVKGIRGTNESAPERVFKFIQNAAILKDANFEEVILNDYKELVAKIVLKRNDIDAIPEDQKEQRTAAKKELEQLVAELNGFFTGEKFTKYSIEAGVLLNSAIRKSLTTLDKEIWLKKVKKIDPENLTPELLKSFDEEYKHYIEDTQATTGKTSKRIAEVVDALLAELGPDLIHATKNGRHKALLSQTLGNLITPEDQQRIELEVLDDKSIPEDKKQEEIQARIQRLWFDTYMSTAPKDFVKLIKTNPNAFTLADFEEVDLALKLIDAGLITISDKYPPEVQEIIKKMINRTAAISKLTSWNSKSIETLVDQINARIKEDNVYSRWIQDILTNPEDSKDSEAPKKSLLDVIGNSITYHPEKFTESISSIDLSNIEDYIKDGIDADSKRLLLLAIYLKAAEILEQAPQLFGYDYDSSIKTLDLLINFIEDLLDVDKIANGNEELAKQILSDFKWADQARAMLPELKRLAERKAKLEATNVIEDPVKNILSKLTKILYNGKFGNIFDIIDELEGKLSDAARIDDYALGADLFLALELAQNVLELLHGVISAALATDYGTNISELARAHAEQQGRQDSYPVLFAEDAEYLFKYLQNVEQKILTLKLIHEQNLKSIIDHDENLRINQNLGLRNYYTNTLSTKTIKINNKEYRLIPDEILEEAKKIQDDEQYVFYIESYLHQLFNDIAKENKVSETFYKELISQIRDTLFTEDGGDLSDASYTLDDAVIGHASSSPLVKNNFIIRRIASLYHYSAKQFKEDLVKIYGANLDSFASYELEVQLRFLLSRLHPEGVQFEQTLLAQLNIDSNPKALLRDPLSNTIKLIGLGGAGKTHILGLASTILTDWKYELYAVSKEETKVNDLALKLHTDEKHSQTLETLFGSHTLAKATQFVSDVNTALVEIKSGELKTVIEVGTEGDLTRFRHSSGFTIVTTGNEKTLKTIEFEDSIFEDCDIAINENSIITVDEATFLNPFLSHFLDYLSRNKKGTIVLAGDPTLMGFYFEANGTKLPYNLDHIYACDLPFMAGNFRMHNEAKSYNLKRFKELLMDVSVGVETDEEGRSVGNDKIIGLYLDPNISPDIIREKVTEFFLNSPLKYKITDEEAYGDLVTTDEALFLATLKQLKEIHPDDSFKFVVDSNNFDTHKTELKQLLDSQGIQISDADILTLSKILGDEADYVIGYKLPGELKTNFDIGSQTASMLVGRSRKFGLYLEDANGLMTSMRLKSEEDPGIRQLKTNFEQLNKLRVEKLQRDLQIIIEEHNVADVDTKPVELDADEVTSDPDDAGTDDIIPDELDAKEVEAIEQLATGLMNNEEKRRQLNFTNAMIIHSVFARTGATRDAIELLEETQSTADVEAWCNQYPDSEIAAVYKHRAEAASLMGLPTFNPTNGELLLDFFRKLRYSLYSQFQNTEAVFAVIADQYNPALDWAYEKVNDDPNFDIKEGNTYLRLTFKLGDGGDASYITLGRVGYDETNSCKIQLDLYNTASKSQSRQIYAFKFDGLNEDSKKLLIDYFKNRGLTDETLIRGCMFRYTGLRDYQIDPTNEQNQKMGLSSMRLTRANLNTLGISIDTKVHHFINVKDFAKWYNSFRFTPVLNTLWMSDLYKRNWVLASMTIGGEKIEFPILVNLTVPKFTPLRYTDIETGKVGNLRYFSIMQILQGYAHLAGLDSAFSNIKIGRKVNELNPKDKTDNLNKLRLAINEVSIKLAELNVDKNIISSLNSVIEFTSSEGDYSKLAFGQSDYDPVITYLQDSKELQNWFFIDSTNEILNHIDVNNSVFTRFFEPPRYYLLLDTTTPINLNQQVGESTFSGEEIPVLEGAQPATEKEISEDLTKLGRKAELKQLDDLVACILKLYKNIDLVQALLSEDPRLKRRASNMLDKLNFVKDNISLIPDSDRATLLNQIIELTTTIQNC